MRNGIRTGSSLLLALLVGCGRGEVKLAPVSGCVYYRGQPLAGGTIVFTPDPDRGGRGPQAWAEVGRDGKYRLSTEERPGAVPGWHRVTVAPLPKDRVTQPAEAGPAEPAAAALPGRFRDPDLSGQCCEVKPEQANHLDLHLE